MVNKKSLKFLISGLILLIISILIHNKYSTELSHMLYENGASILLASLSIGVIAYGFLSKEISSNPNQNKTKE